MKLGQLLEGEPFKVSSPHLLNEEVKSWTDRSSDVQEGTWFIAARGETIDGHTFIPDAIARKAAGVIFEDSFDLNAKLRVPFVTVANTRRLVNLISSRWYRAPSRRMHVVGVTGTNGKTTTAFLIRHLMNPTVPTGVIGTVEAGWNREHLPLSNTTPGARELNSILGRMVQDGIRHCALEVSSHALKQGRVDGIYFQSALFTNLTRDHLDYHKTFEDYFDSKSKLFFEFPGIQNRMINLDDPYGKRLWDRLGPVKKIGFSIRTATDYYASDIQCDLEGTRFSLACRGRRFRVSSPLLCVHNVYNLVAAIASCVEAGADPEGILERVSSFEGVPGRLERIRLPNGAWAFIDYAHSPDAILNITSSLAPLKKGRIITLFGCGGNRDRGKRPVMGKIAADFSDYVILTSDNPREEAPHEILRQIAAGISDEKMAHSVSIIEDRRQALWKACQMAQGNDMLLVLGKGHEDYQIVGRKKYHFSDSVEIKEWAKRYSRAFISNNLPGVLTA
ncbi:MAG: UDP-N-acetylmuramoyl-L-alanyl-D-glutamate--2,6-diaminopimelate ligase [Candidatus Omnitrophica bacterium]|nr:UDP-N-acetylmuramoyl-L-alanyl-D-glutamate--2,6-diaminopimelate ligase [Candidatus Omnitrophota bacterium]